MSKFYGNEDMNYPDVGQNNSNPYEPKNEVVAPTNTFAKAQDRALMRDSVFLKDSEEKKDPSCLERCCKCCTIDYYKDNFQVDNEIVKKRILFSLKFWSGGFFEDLKADYDYYGPFWIYTTLVFLCSAVHNVLRYEANNSTFAYSFRVIGVSLGIFYLLGMAVSALYGLIFGCMGLNCKTAHIICLYGYAMAGYTFCVLLCIFNSPLLTWLFLLYGAGTKNMFQKLDVPPAKKFLIVIMVLLEAFIQLMAIKFALIVNYNSVTGAPVHFGATPLGGASHFGDFLHFRSHPSL